MTDPTADEMRAFLATQLCGESPADHEFDIEAAIYWFASNYHAGQATSLYEALCDSAYSPGRASSGPEPDSMESDLYEALEAEYGR